MVYGLALSILRNPEDAEEAAQDAFVKLFVSRQKFDTARDLEPWLLRIAGNAGRDRLRRRLGVDNDVEADAADVVGVVVADGAAPATSRALADKRVCNDRLVASLEYQFCYPSYREGLHSILTTPP